MKFLPYNAEQGYLLPPSVQDVRGENHLCFFIPRVVEGLDLGGLAEDYGEEGRRAYAPALMVKVWLYAAWPRWRWKSPWPPRRST